ncbi:MAG: right-handed parallel beta-helix repeat-containing protein [Candidatus Bathyarchaeia archaeon]
MFRKPASIIMLSLLALSALALAHDVQPVKSDYTWTEPIYIQADGSIQPPTAPISRVDNVTYTLTDNIAGNVPVNSSAIIIQRDNITIDGAGHTLQGTLQAQYSIGIELTGRSNVTIKNMKITAYTYGIVLCSSSNINVSGNNITNGSDGIVLYSSSYNSISVNNMANNFYWDIDLYSSSNNTFYHNNIMNNARQVFSYNSTNVWDNAAAPALPIYLYILAALAIVIAVGAVVLIVRRKKRPPEEARSPEIIPEYPRVLSAIETRREKSGFHDDIAWSQHSSNVTSFC